MRNVHSAHQPAQRDDRLATHQTLAEPTPQPECDSRPCLQPGSPTPTPAEDRSERNLPPERSHHADSNAAATVPYRRQPGRRSGHRLPTTAAWTNPNSVPPATPEVSRTPTSLVPATHRRPARTARTPAPDAAARTAGSPVLTDRRSHPPHPSSTTVPDPIKAIAPGDERPRPDDTQAVAHLLRSLQGDERPQGKAAGQMVRLTRFEDGFCSNPPVVQMRRSEGPTRCSSPPRTALWSWAALETRTSGSVATSLP